MNNIPANELQSLKKIKEKFFKEKNKNIEKLFSNLGENNSIILSLFSDEEIFEIYQNFDFKVDVFAII